ncbi:MAG TPA: H-X9-DG-CTERM domain-containing protein [Tepidisphaeraceae bacterium]|nr:H-X9-DG-CTERM domain-containing protein [Tepidisphaeraceae bacterium]
MHIKITRFACLCLLLSLMLSGFTQAAPPLADQAPADTWVYVGWAGVDALQSAYEQSNLGAVVKQSNLPQLLDQHITMFWSSVSGPGRRGGAEDPQVAAARQIVSILWHHPTSFYWQAMPTPIATPTYPRAGLVCDAGADAAALTQLFRGLGPRAFGPGTRVIANGTIIMMTAGKPAPGGLVADPAFTAAMPHVQSSPAICIYANVTGALEQINQLAATDHDSAVFWPKVRDALGLNNIKTYARSAGFEGADWGTAAFLAVPSPRAGVLTAIEPHAMDPALLARIPVNANSFSVLDFDAGKLVDTIHEAFVASSQEKAFNMGTGAISVMLGRNLRRQLLAPLGGQWVMYSTPDSHGPVLLNKVTDEKTEQDALVSALYGISNLVNTQFGSRGGPPIVTASQSQSGDLTVTTATVKEFAPSFAIRNGIVYFGMSPDAVTAAATMADVTGSTVATQRDVFTAARQRLGVSGDLTGNFSFANLPETAAGAYKSLGQESKLVHDLAVSSNIPWPEIDLPTFEELKPHLSPAVSLRWADDAGIYTKSISPFPLSGALLGDSQSAVMSSGAVAAIASVVAPALARGRATSQRVQCASNERHILMGIIQYTNDHNGEYPPDLGSLMKYINSPVVFVCASAGTVVPPEILLAPKDKQAAWVNENTDYIYHGKGLSTAKSHAMTPVVSERPTDHGPDGMNVGFADGHVEWVNAAQAKKMLNTAPDAGEQGL